ncbi:MAG TPA: Ku protein [Acidimicrobiales bacterium]|nr:Ku protein [Acidimicrobiales bacterium]
MPPRSLWSGAISFGLVNVPVKMMTAVSPKDVRFNQLHAKDHSRIQQKRFCADEGVEVAFDELVKGYEVRPGAYVVIDPAELDGLDPVATHTIDILEFVDLDQIDPVYFDKPYYLVPDNRAEKAYALLAQALERSGKVGIAKFVMRTKEYLAAIRSAKGALVISTLLYGDEVVPIESLNTPGLEVELTERELKMAEALIESLTEKFDPERHEDTYREKVMELIRQKDEGEEIVIHAEAEEPKRVDDLMAALEASVQAARDKRAAGDEG